MSVSPASSRICRSSSPVIVRRVVGPCAFAPEPHAISSLVFALLDVDAPPNRAGVVEDIVKSLGALLERGVSQEYGDRLVAVSSRYRHGGVEVLNENDESPPRRTLRVLSAVGMIVHPKPRGHFEQNLRGARLVVSLPGRPENVRPGRLDFGPQPFAVSPEGVGLLWSGEREFDGAAGALEFDHGRRCVQ